MFHFRSRSFSKANKPRKDTADLDDDEVSLEVVVPPKDKEPVLDHYENLGGVSREEQRRRDKVMELCTMYELDEDRDTSLRKLVLPTKTTSSTGTNLGSSLGAGHMAVLAAQRPYVSRNAGPKPFQEITTTLNLDTAKKNLLADDDGNDKKFPKSTPHTAYEKEMNVEIPTSPASTVPAETPSPVEANSAFSLPGMC